VDHTFTVKRKLLTATTPDATKPGVADQAQKAEEAAKKAGVTAKAKANQKALPKTHAVK